MLLEGLKLPYDLHQLEFSDARQPEYLRLNPSGLLPTIRIQNTDITLLETAIIVYLIDQYDKEDKLFYRDEPGKYLTQQWLAFQISGQDPYFGQAAWFARFHPEKVQSAIDRYASEIIRGHWHLGRRPGVERDRLACW